MISLLYKQQCLLSILASNIHSNPLIEMTVPISQKYLFRKGHFKYMSICVSLFERERVRDSSEKQRLKININWDFCDKHNRVLHDFPSQRQTYFEEITRITRTTCTVCIQNILCNFCRAKWLWPNFTFLIIAWH